MSNLNDTLTVRAAVSFNELTPRYRKFKEFFCEYDLNFWEKKDKKKKKVDFKISDEKNDPFNALETKYNEFFQKKSSTVKTEILMEGYKKLKELYTEKVNELSTAQQKLKDNLNE